MLTKKLYYEDSYIKEFEATVTKVGDGFIVLDRTAFFPEAGGQTSDCGWINENEVVSVSEKDGEIRHYTGGTFAEGDAVKGRLDFEERLRKMRNHTAEHMFCGIVHRKYGYENVGFHLSDVVTFDFSGELTAEQVSQIEKEINESILKNMPVTAWFPDERDIQDISFRSKLELEQMPQLRLVRIGDIDLCACCAPHVKNTGEIGAVKILTCERHRGGMRLTLVAGMDAFMYFDRYQRSVTEISGVLSSPREIVASAVRKLRDDRDRIKYEMSRMELDAVNSLPVDDNCVFVSLSDDAQRKYCNILMEYHEIAAVFSGDKYIIGSKSVDLRAKSKEINEVIDGRGGGKPEMISGTAKADMEIIHNYFSFYL